MPYVVTVLSDLKLIMAELFATIFIIFITHNIFIVRKILKLWFRIYVTDYKIIYLLISTIPLKEFPIS